MQNLLRVALVAATGILLPIASMHASAGERTVRTISGSSSYYGPGFHGRRTANGERFDQYAMTAAHKTLAFGTKLKVTNRNNGRSVVVRVNDRGPYHGGRILDLSTGAASRIGMTQSGTAAVRVEILG